VLVLDVHADELDAIRRSLGGTEKLATDALRAALAKTMRWANTRVRRAVSAGVKVPQKALKTRLVLRLPKRTDLSGAIWIGLNPIGAIHLNPRRTAAGVRGGAHDFEGAFIAKGRGGARQVFKRAGSSRLPIERVHLSIADAGRAAIRGPLFAGIERFFLRTFEHELGWRIARA
jgi:hypothetical protein